MLYLHSNEYLNLKKLMPFEKKENMLAIAGGSDIALILAGLHEIKNLTVCDIDSDQLKLFHTKYKFATYSPEDFLLYFYIPIKWNPKLKEQEDIPIQKFLRDFYDQINEDKYQLYHSFYEDYVRAFQLKNNRILNNLKKVKNVDYLIGDIYSNLSDKYDIIYLSNVYDYVKDEERQKVLQSLKNLKNDAIIYDSSLLFTDKSVCELKKYSKKEYFDKIEKTLPKSES
ncbi:MAG: hypothetical protein QW524_03895 [Candidatus Woesearchaeota archaeon]